MTSKWQRRKWRKSRMSMGFNGVSYNWIVKRDQSTTLTKIERCILGLYIPNHYHCVTIWKRGWHHIKGARKRAKKISRPKPTT